MNSFFRTGVALSLATVSSFALVADYRYDECSGTTIENHAGSELKGQLSSTGATLTADESTLSLTGTGSMSVEHNSKLDLVKSMTISLWVKQSKRGQQALITRGEGEGSNRKFAANAEYFLSVNSTGKIRYKHNGVSGTYSDSAIPLNTWTHVVVTRDYTNKQVKIYINGALDSTYSYSTNPVSSNSEKLLVGKCSGCNGTSEFRGQLDEIKIYNNNLSNAKIVELFEAEKEDVHSKSTCTVTPKPTATNDREEVFTTGDVRFNVLDNDVDNNTEDSCTIQTNSVILTALAGAELSDDGKMLVVNNQGMWSVNNTGMVTFTPDNGYTNSPTPVAYHISDSCGNDSDEATITLIRQETNPNPDTNTKFTFGDKVWLDANRNGLQDNGEAGMGNIRVILLNPDGTEVARTTTNANGEYSFENIDAGDYSIKFENLPTGNTFTTQGVGDNTTIDSDVNAQGISNTFTVATGNSINISAGILNSVGGNDGQDGANGHNGKDGNDGVDGHNGNDGKDGVDGHDGNDGKDGVDGHDGNDGKDGVDGHDGNDGKDGVNGHDGKDGKDAVCSCQTDTKSDDCGCECKTYETSVPVLSSIGIGTMLFISTLLGMLLFRRETLLKNNSK